MRIGLDTHELVNRSRSGIGKYLKNLYNTLFRIFPNDTFVILNWFDYSMVLQLLDDCPNVSEYYVEQHQSKIEMVNIRENISKIVANFISYSNIEVFYTSDTFDSSFPIYRREWFGNTKLIMTVHDITPWIFKDIFLNSEEKMSSYKSNFDLLSNYDLIFANSENTKNDICKFLKDGNVYNIYMDMDVKECNDDTVKTAWNRLKYWENIEKGSYFLFVGGAGINKNLSRTLRAYLHLYKKNKDIPLFAIVGSLSEENLNSLDYFGRRYGISEKILPIGYAAEEELVALYRNAFWTVFTSYYEGFGMPVLEAWQQGCPVITSNNSSLGEISVGAAIQVDPFSVDSIESGLQTAVDMSDDERNGYVTKGYERKKNFSWESTARKARKYIDGLFEG